MHTTGHIMQLTEIKNMPKSGATALVCYLGRTSGSWRSGNKTAVQRIECRNGGVGEHELKSCMPQAT